MSCLGYAFTLRDMGQTNPGIRAALCLGDEQITRELCSSQGGGAGATALGFRCAARVRKGVSQPWGMWVLILA